VHTGTLEWLPLTLQGIAVRHPQLNALGGSESEGTVHSGISAKNMWRCDAGHSKGIWGERCRRAALEESAAHSARVLLQFLIELRRGYWGPRIFLFYTEMRIKLNHYDSSVGGLLQTRHFNFSIIPFSISISLYTSWTYIIYTVLCL
jgi:hypothetical protein